MITFVKSKSFFFFFFYQIGRFSSIGNFNVLSFYENLNLLSFLYFWPPPGDLYI